MQRKSLHLPYFIFGLLCIAIAFLLLSNIIRGIVTKNSSDVFRPSMQRIELIIPASGFIAKTEHIVLAHDDGKVERLHEAGEMLRKQTDVAHLKKVSQQIDTVINEHEGILTFIKDECEEKYALSNLDQLLFQEILNPPVKQSRVGDDQSVKKGDFIFKIVENDLMHFVLVIDPRYQEILQSIFQDRFSTGSEINFRAESPSNLIVGCKVEKNELREKDQQLIVLSTPYYIDLMVNQRKLSGSFTFGYVTASLIPPSALLKDEAGKYYVIEKKEEPQRVDVNLLGMDPASMQYIVSGIETTQELYIHAKVWDKTTTEP